MKKITDRRDQSDNLDFNGQNNNDKPAGYSREYQSNASGREARENYGPGPRVAGRTGKTAGPATAAGRSPGPRKWAPAAGPNYQGNPDRINAGAGPRRGNQR